MTNMLLIYKVPEKMDFKEFERQIILKLLGIDGLNVNKKLYNKEKNIRTLMMEFDENKFKKVDLKNG